VIGRLGAVAIGRNEGERLRRCLASLVGRVRVVVYVDSGSTDGSVEMARAMGVLVTELDRAQAFTAARARNAGLARLDEAAPDLELVQFVDGDCEVAAGWSERAERELVADPRLAVVCGRRRERYPERSIYNRLCDLEWDTPIGLADACGGDALMRVEAVRAVNGYDPSLIAGEEPDLCLRLRRLGWKVLRVDAEMTLHDAAMTRFPQWWKRSLRAGHAYAEGAARQAGGAERYWAKEVRSNWAWGLFLPIGTLAVAVATGGLGLALLAAYGALGARVYRGMRRREISRRDARLAAFFCVIGKVPQGLGQALYWVRRIAGRRGALIEYKGPDRAA
jgi:glycosyltransferase involved in cell wall biosynthesis